MIRKATVEDIDILMVIYDKGRAFMRQSGNLHQWTNGYPSRSLVENDIRSGNQFVVEKEGRIAATFAFIEGDDPTYDHIEGRWLNGSPYGTIHRLASDGTAPGIATECFRFCLEKKGNVRADTHPDNIRMKDLLEKFGFVRCGVIHLADGTPRIAYQLFRFRRDGIC